MKLRSTVALGALLATTLVGSPAQAARGGATAPVEPATTVDQDATEPEAGDDGAGDEVDGDEVDGDDAVDNGDDGDHGDDASDEEETADDDADEGDDAEEGDDDGDEDEDEDEDEAEEDDDAEDEGEAEDGDDDGDDDDDGEDDEEDDDAPPVDPDPGTDTPVPPTDPDPNPPVTVTAPDAPEIGTASPGDAGATVRWTAPGNDGGQPVNGYEVQAVEDVTGHVVAVHRATADAVELRLTGLRNGTAYAFSVRALNASGTSDFSATSNVVVPTAPRGPAGPTTPTTPTPPTTTPPPAIRTVPGVPRMGSARAGAGSATVRWTAPATDGGSPILRYQVQVLDAAGDAMAGAARVTPADTSMLVVAGLTDGRTYRFRVRAVNAIGAGARSRASGAVTPYTVPGRPNGVTVARGGSGGAVTAVLRWSAPTGGPVITGYRITRQRLAADGTPAGPSTTVTLPCTVRRSGFTAPRGVPAGTAYRFTVQAFNGAGRSGGRTVVGIVR